MKDYLLFLDTEASGLPKKWDKPYTDSNNWPFSVQISWVIYTNNGTFVKQEDHYIGDQDFDIKPSAIKIHGIDRDYLADHGKSRATVMQLLADDLNYYQPLVTGHFMEFDFHVTSADFCRAGIPNPLENLPTFCTMLASSHYVRDPSIKYLKLGELYSHLFKRKLENQHNALADAQATADCFFELRRKSEITDEIIEAQLKAKALPIKAFKGLFILLLVVAFTILICLWL